MHADVWTQVNVKMFRSDMCKRFEDIRISDIRMSRYPDIWIRANTALDMSWLESPAGIHTHASTHTHTFWNVRRSWQAFQVFDSQRHFLSCFSSFLSVLALGSTVILRVYSCLDLGPKTGRLQHVIAGVACHACHSSGTFFSVTHTHYSKNIPNVIHPVLRRNSPPTWPSEKEKRHFQ